MKTLGIIDSGIGGLTFVQELKRLHLNVKIFYVCDSKNVPYGTKSQEFMYRQTLQMVQALLLKKVDAIFLACNTLTARTIDRLRLQLKIPVIGIEPYLRYIEELPLEAKGALILTPATFASERFQKLRDLHDPMRKIDVFPLPRLALLIESLKENDLGPIKMEIAQEVSMLQNKGYTHLILGCTHYPLISAYLENLLHLKTVDPTPSVLARIIDLLELSETGGEEGFSYSEDCGDHWNLKYIRDFAFLRSTL